MEQKTVKIRSTGEQNTDVESTKVFECSCNASARFMPLYRFNESGAKAQLVLGPMHPGAIMCGGCRQVYKWVPPTTPDGHDGGWERDSLLEDLIRLVDATSQTPLPPRT